ncbi:MAG TPA: cupin domain-containing protein [Candidatus Binatia bacterium]|jgi:quercetin dioxygenase-like cupin family protein
MPNITANPVHLGLGATAVVEPQFTGMAWYDAYTERHASDGIEGRLVSMYTFEKSWDVWEMHPHGSEVVLCTSGEMTLTQERDGKASSVLLRAGDYAINEPRTWHTVDVERSATAVFITAGVGTLHRPR